MGSAILQFVWALTPPVLVLAIFWFVLRSVTRADRHERKVYNRMEDEERARRGMPPRTPQPLTRADRATGFAVAPGAGAAPVDPADRTV